MSKSSGPHDMDDEWWREHGDDSSDDDMPQSAGGGVWGAIKSIGVQYDELIDNIVRPERSIYSLDRDIGPEILYTYNTAQSVFREDFEVPNNKGHKLSCSWWRPNPIDDSKPLPAIVFLHGNSSCRIDALDLITPALEGGFILVAFDFSGSGLSEGEFVSLGWQESFDIKAVVAHLHGHKAVSHVALWGRSMGAVAALLCHWPLSSEEAPKATTAARAAEVGKTMIRRASGGFAALAAMRAGVTGTPAQSTSTSGGAAGGPIASEDPDAPTVVAMVLDSPFASFAQLAVELVNSGQINVPKFAVYFVLRFIRRSIQKKTGLDVFALKPVGHVPGYRIPALFGCATDDTLINNSHSKTMHAKYGQIIKKQFPNMRIHKQLFEFSGHHNSPRPDRFYESGVMFIKNAIQIALDEKKNPGRGMASLEEQDQQEQEGAGAGDGASAGAGAGASASASAGAGAGAGAGAAAGTSSGNLHEMALPLMAALSRALGGGKGEKGRTQNQRAAQREGGGSVTESQFEDEQPNATNASATAAGTAPAPAPAVDAATAAATSNGGDSDSTWEDVGKSVGERDINALGVKELKGILRARGVPHNDCLTKEDLVERVGAVLLSEPVPNASANVPKRRKSKEEQLLGVDVDAAADVGAEIAAAKAAAAGPSQSAALPAPHSADSHSSSGAFSALPDSILMETDAKADVEADI